MGNFLEKDSISRSWALEELLRDRIGYDELGFLHDVDIYVGEDGDTLVVYAKGAEDDADPVATFWLDISVSEIKPDA